MAAAATPLLRDLPDEVILWEILVRLDPKSLLRCRAVRRDWRSATSDRGFLLAHHARPLHLLSLRVPEEPHEARHPRPRPPSSTPSPSLTITTNCWAAATASSSSPRITSRLAFVAASSSATPPPVRVPDFRIKGMYLHRPTGEYRLLLQGRKHEKRGPPSDRTGFYVLALGSHQSPRYVGCSETKLVSAFLSGPAWLRDCLHFHRVYYRNPSEYYKVQRELVIVFDTIAESFREMRAPLVHTSSRIFEMDDMLGIYTCNNMTTAQIVDIWVLRNYESEVWDLKYRVELPIAGIRGKPEGLHGGWFLAVVSVDGDVLLLVCTDSSLFYIDTDGKLVATLQDRCVYPESHLLKQTLVHHDFFTALEGYAVNSSPIIPSV